MKNFCKTPMSMSDMDTSPLFLCMKVSSAGSRAKKILRTMPGSKPTMIWLMKGILKIASKTGPNGAGSFTAYAQVGWNLFSLITNMRAANRTSHEMSNL
jgi:hypothetical protein